MSATELEFEMEAPVPAKKVNAQELEKKSGEQNEDGTVNTYTKLEQDIIDDLDKQVEVTVKDIYKARAGDQQMQDITAALSKMGDEEIRSSSSVSNRMLSRSIKNMKENEVGGGGKIASSLKDLRTKVTDLDPSNRDKLFNRDKIFGIKIPFGLGRKVDSYFQEYQSAESQLKDIITSLNNGKDELLLDNATIDEERSNMLELMKKLEQFAYIMKKVDKKISDRLPEIEETDKLKASDIKQEILFPIRQKRMDLLQHMAVCMQGYVALQVIKTNNKELIRGVDRATKTTVAALRTAIVISEALGTQKLVLDQITSVNDVTNKMIESSANMLEQQGVQIQKQATEAAISTETLQKSFKQIFKALDSLDTYRENALEPMQKTIENLEATVSEAKNYMISKRKENVKDFEKEVMTDEQPKVEKSSTVKIR